MLLYRLQIQKIQNGRPTEIVPSFKERLPKNISLHNSLARYRDFRFDNTEQFQFPNFHRASYN